MFKRLTNKLGTTVYVQIWENRIKLTDSKTGRVVEEKPLVAIGTDDKGAETVVGFGKLAAADGQPNLNVVNPFSHPRMLFSDFRIGVRLLQFALKELLGNKVMLFVPALVIHPMEKTEGGLTTIEVRAFKEFAFGAGAREAVVYQGRTLSLQDLDFAALVRQAGNQ